MYYTVYQVTNLVNGKIYVGVHRTDDLDDGYMGSGDLIKRAIEKYGSENFNKEILYIFHSAENMFEKEALIVDESFVKRGDTYNKTVGGKGGGFYYVNDNGLNNTENQHLIAAQRLQEDPEYREEFSRLISEGLRRYYNSNPNFVGTFTGRRHSDETKEIMSQKAKQRFKDNPNLNPSLGKSWVYNDGLKVSKLVDKRCVDDYINEGWKKGRKLKF